MIIILDTMGFENSVKEPIIAARKFVKKFPDVEIILVGNKIEIQPLLKNEYEFKIYHTEVFVSQKDNVMSVLRYKKNSSMAISMDLVNDGKGDAILSAGSTPCFVGLSYYKFGIIKNITKPAFTPSFPSTNGKGFNMLDVGANIEANHLDLVNFALMANIYVQKIKSIKNPSIALLNIGVEEHKGLESIKLAHKILKKNKTINYIGFIESRDLLKGEVDIIITDGFTGNICLKAIEGTSKTISGEIKKNFKNPINWLGCLFSIFLFSKLKKTFNYKNNAGAIFLGLNKIAIKTHGSADWKQFYSSLELAKKSIENNVSEHLRDKFKNENKN